MKSELYSILSRTEYLPIVFLLDNIDFFASFVGAELEGALVSTDKHIWTPNAGFYAILNRASSAPVLNFIKLSPNLSASDEIMGSIWDYSSPLKVPLRLGEIWHNWVISCIDCYAT